MTATFTDEHLNLALRLCAQAAHKRTMELSVFYCFDILGQVGGNTYIFAPNADLPEFRHAGRPGEGGAPMGDEPVEGARAVVAPAEADQLEHDGDHEDGPDGGGEDDEPRPPSNTRLFRDVLRRGGGERPRAKRRKMQP